RVHAPQPGSAGPCDPKGLLSTLGIFFSSRRRHTKSTRDWSSDVCSSDLDALARPGAARDAAGSPPRGSHRDGGAGLVRAAGREEIGRASCRERVQLGVVGELAEENPAVAGLDVDASVLAEVSQRPVQAEL